MSGTPATSSSLAEQGSRKRKRTTNPNAVKVKRTRCGECGPCKRQDCRECLPCKDKKKYGGPGTRHKACIYRECEALKQVPETTTTNNVRANESHCLEYSSESEAGESSDDDADKEKGIETDSEAPTLAELQGNPSQIAMSISLVDPATEARDGPEETEAGGDSATMELIIPLTNEENGIDSEAPQIERNPSLMSGSQVDPASEANDEPEVDRTGSTITELLKPIAQKVTELQNELKVKENELSWLRQTEREQSQRIQQLEAAGKRQELEKEREIAKLKQHFAQHSKNQEAEISHLQTTAQQLEEELQGEVALLRNASKQYAQQLQEKDDEISRLRLGLQKLTEVQEQLNVHVAQQAQKKQEITQLRKRVAQLQTAVDEKQQKISQSEETVRKHKELEHQREQLSRQQAIQQMNQIQDQQMRLEDREKEVAELKEQERKMKEWLTGIPMHGLQVTSLPS